MSTPALPKTLGKYRIDAILGEGAMGTVYRGFDPVLSRPVAIKTLHKALLEDGHSGAFLERFRHEAKAVATFDHPNIVTVHDYGEERGIPYIVMELIEGQDLKAILRQNGPPDLERTLSLMRQALDALAYCHARGVVHRDLKPANIVLLPDERIKITDFGIAHVQGSDLTQLGDQLGTPAYMSPEQLLGEPVDARSDLFAAGVVLYELLSGKQQSLGQVLSDIGDRTTASQIDSRLSAVARDLLHKALAKQPEERFQSAEQFAEALAELAQTQEATVVRPAQQSGKKKRFGLVWLVAIIVAVPPIGWMLWEMYGHEQPTPELGTIHIASWPPGAVVWQADRQLGTTPQRIELPAGSHEIVLKLDGYQDLSASMEVEPGADIDFELPLVRLQPGD